jgi:LysM repeat protein
MIKILVLMSWAYLNPAPAADSIGKEVINGKVHVIHRVGEKETLYGISKRYGTTVDAILQQNPTADGGLEVGQILKVPFVSFPKKIQAGDKHVVAEKETLFSVSKLYGITIDELRQLNNLSSSSLSVGQELIVKKGSAAVEQSVIKTASAQSLKGVHTVVSKETLFSISKLYNISIDQLKQWNNITGSEVKVGQNLFVVQPMNGVVQTNAPAVEVTTRVETPVEVTKGTTPIKISEGYKDGKEVKETGLSELIEGTQGNRKYLALHRTAPTGTILKVKNQMNDREVFVRVVGKLPETGQNDKLVIKISKSAYDRLGAIDPKFLVEVTWYK